VDGEDVGVVEGGDGAGFVLETPPPVGVGGGVLGEDLQGDVATEARIVRPVDLAHPPGPEGGPDLVGPQMCARAQGHLHLAMRSA
jgi:hypothetical protein